MADKKNLWPEFKVEKINLPKNILVEQADFITEMTNKNILGKISTTNQSGSIYHSFRLQVPALQNYTYYLFSVKHDPILIYPLTINWRDSFIPVPNESEFLTALEQIFKHESTQKVVSSILAQVGNESPTQGSSDDLPF